MQSSMEAITIVGKRGALMHDRQREEKIMADSGTSYRKMSWLLR